MAARTISERAKWDGRQRQNPKSRRSSASLARDPYHIPPETHSLDILQSQARISDSRRAEKATFHSNHERDSLTNSSSNARLRLSSRVDTTSTSFRHPHEASITNTAPNPALRSLSLITSPHVPPNSFLTASRIHNLRPTMSRDHSASSQPKSTVDTEVIDLTLEDTEDELTVKNLLLSNSTSANSKGKHADPGPSRHISSSAHSSPIAADESLFTPPPHTKKRSRCFIDFIRVPSFPKGLTRADYGPLFDQPVVSLPSNTVTNQLDDPSLAEASVEEDGASQKRNGKERAVEIDVSSPKKHRRPSADGVDLIPGEILDAIYEHSLIPVYDDEAYPPLTNLELATNTRLQFAHAWRGHASKLQEDEREWMFKIFGNACIWPTNAPSPCMPGTVGYVSSEQLRPWKLALPGDPPEGERVGEQTESQATLDINADFLSLPGDPLPGPTTALDPAPSNPTLAQGSTVVGMEDDMHQYFNGLGDSPTKHVPPRQQLAPTHTFRPQLLQSAGRSEMHSLALAFPSLDPRLADTGDHQCFLGLPPSPPPADMEPSAISGPISEPPFESTYAPASPSNIFEDPPADTWSFEQGEGLLLKHNSPVDKPVESAAPGTIDPSLLGPEQSQMPPRAPENPTPKRRSKLPEPVIYIRRPIDSSSLPNLSGKRSVQIKYRESENSRAPSDPGVHPIEEPKNNSPPARRRSAPSRKLHISDSDSDYAPEPSASGIKLKIKRPSVRAREKEKEPVVERQEPVPSLTFCHQCRRTTERPKMLCSNELQGRFCGKRFCNRCILYRYPDVTFDEDSAGFLCPVCTNTCNCSHCSRNRGEEFISMRLGGLAASLFKTRVTLVRDVGEPLPHTLSPPSRPAATADGQSASAATTPTPEPGTMPTPSHFWAHVYGMEGERVGSAFMTRENMTRLQTRGPSTPPLPLPPPPPSIPKPPKPPKKARQSTTRREKQREQPRGPRVFIGRPLASWKMRGVRDLEPSVDVVDTTATTPTMQVGTRRRRCFIGHAAPLYEPYGRMPGATGSSTTPTTTSRCTTPVLGSDGSLTPLSELEEDRYDRHWPQPAVGECCSWAPPGRVSVPLLNRSGEGAGSGSGSGSGVEVEVKMDVEEESKGVSPLTGLSEEQIKMAISAALAAVDGGGP